MISPKEYSCSRCGKTTIQSTNHYGQTYSVGRYNACPVCPPIHRPTIWNCVTLPPEGEPIPGNWVQVQIEIDG